MKILVIGSGGREHALVSKIAESTRVSKIYCAPGNPGIEKLAECVPIEAGDISRLADFAKKNKIDLTVVGPEVPLVAGVVDVFKRMGLKIFGPSKEASQLEGSKAFSKDFCIRYNIPTARAETFTDTEAAIAYIRTNPLPVVVKADGLAAGKGVAICNSLKEAEKAVKGFLLEKWHGEAGTKIIVEEFLDGEEASFIAISDGNHVLPLESSKDHKRVFDGDRGPNTGGMGAVSPAPVVTPQVAQKVMEDILLPTARGMVTEGMPFVGVIYAGLMIKNGEPKLLEFNVRFGDPETEVLIPRLKTDIVDVFEAAISGMLHNISLEWDVREAACVVMASKGYPGEYEKGKKISGLDKAKSSEDVFVFHAGTKKDGADIVTSGGRVLCVSALGVDTKDALNRAYETIEKITWDGAHYRKDIGKQI